jgi:hypothetical protein
MKCKQNNSGGATSIPEIWIYTVIKVQIQTQQDVEAAEEGMYNRKLPLSP